MAGSEYNVEIGGFTFGEVAITLGVTFASTGDVDVWCDDAFGCRAWMVRARLTDDG